MTTTSTQRTASQALDEARPAAKAAAREVSAAFIEGGIDGVAELAKAVLDTQIPGASTVVGTYIDDAAGCLADRSVQVAGPCTDGSVDASCYVAGAVLDRSTERSW